MTATELREALAVRTRVALGTFPTPLHEGPRLPGGARLLVKRDDLTGLGMGGNKVRKLEYLCGDACRSGADTLVTVGAAQSNHARLTAAAGAVLGMPTHLVLGGDRRQELMGNQLLDELFGAELNFPGTEDWDALEAHMRTVVGQLERQGRRPYQMPIGGSTAVGVLGFANAWLELMDQCADLGTVPACVVHASSSGGTHAGLLAGRAACAAEGEVAPSITAVGVAKLPMDLAGESVVLANQALDDMGIDVRVGAAEAVVDGRWQGSGYAVPTAEADEAMRWAARHAGLVLDRVYTGKAFAGLLGAARAGQWGDGDTVVFWHTGGQPAVFAVGGAPTRVATARTPSTPAVGSSR